jgi:hypothetical protein
MPCYATAVEQLLREAIRLSAHVVCSSIIMSRVSVGNFLLTKGRRTYFRVLKKENYFVIILAGVGTVHICVISTIFSLNPKIACLLLLCFITYILKNE